MVRIAGKLLLVFSVMKRIASVNGKKKWWFVVKAPERSLQCVDKAWNHKFWRWQRVFGSSGGSSSKKYFRIGTCVNQRQVSQSDTICREMGWTENLVDEVRLGIYTKLKVCFWNVCGWSGGGGGQMERRVQEHDMRAEMIGYYKPDVSALAETQLKGDEVINLQGYKLFTTIGTN